MKLRRLAEHIQEREDQLFLVLTLVIGAIVGLTIVAFIVATERVGLRLYPADGAPWRRLATPVIGALVTGYFLYRYFPDARGSGIPQTKTALFAGNGTITLHTVIGKFCCSSASLASGSRNDVTRVEGIITLDDILRVYGLHEESNGEAAAEPR